VQVGRPRARQAGDDDGADDLEVVDLGMPVQQIPDQQAVLDHLDQLAVPADDPGGTEAGFGP
jgi:hypothetical protein